MDNPKVLADEVKIMNICIYYDTRGWGERECKWQWIRYRHWRHTIGIKFCSRTAWYHHPFHLHQPIEPHCFRRGRVIGNARLARTAKDCWNPFVSENVIQEVLRWTNQKIRENRPTSLDEERTTGHGTYDKIERRELRAIFGGLYLADIHKSSHTNLWELWRKGGTGIEFFRLICSEKRFGFIQGEA